MKYLYLILIISTILFSSNFENITKSVIDNKSNIMWQDNIEVTQYKENIIMAKIYCSELILNGYTNWKLPNIKQLITIVDPTNKRYINKKFKFVSGSRYISTTKFILDNSKLWYIDFKNGQLGYKKNDLKYNIRCLRDINE